MYSTCTSQEFKTDISQLCDNCPLKHKIPQYIEDKIIFQAKERYDINPDSIFNYIESEIKNAEEAMTKMFLESKKEGTYLNKVSEIYIWNKERIKALVAFKKSILPNPQQPTITIPDSILQKLQTTNKIGNNTVKQMIENANNRPLKWLVTKQNLRELLTHDKIKGDYSIAEIERQAPCLFVDRNGNPLNLARDKKKGSFETDFINQILES